MNKVVAIIGQGYVGLPLAVEAAKAGWLVKGVEISHNKYELLRNGISPVEDVESKELISLIKNGSYEAHNDYQIIQKASIVILCVPTPIDSEHNPDLEPLTQACESLLQYIQPETLLVNESTSFPGTLRKLIQSRVLKLDFSERILLAAAPERIDPGNALWKQWNTPRLVGGINEESSKRAIDFYSSFCSSVVKVGSPEIAEMAKLLENSFRLVNIALINEMSLFSHKVGIDIREVVDAAATKPYGYMPFYPSAGIGGHCIPVDPHYLMKTMVEIGESSRILEVAAQSNIERPKRILSTALGLAANCNSILIVGVAYKPGLSDTREAAAEKIAQQALMKNIRVYWWDNLVQTCHYGEKWNGHDVDVVIVTSATALEGLNVAALGLPILDCTGTLKEIPRVTIL